MFLSCSKYVFRYWWYSSDESPRSQDHTDHTDIHIYIPVFIVFILTNCRLLKQQLVVADFLRGHFYIIIHIIYIYVHANFATVYKEKYESI